MRTGKSKKEMDNLLPLYAKIIDSICPCSVDEFETAFNNAMRPALKNNATQKTLDNHRTEVAGQLFGMYYISDDGKVYASDRALKFLEDGDTPAFFKDLCYKMQFPNGSQKWQTVKDRIDNKISIRQFPFLLKVMLLAKAKNITLTIKEIGFYILNSLDVLQGIANPLEVYDVISYDRKNNITRDIKTPDKASSYDWQHIREQINLLELANLIIVDGGDVSLNPNEINVIQVFADDCNAKPVFDVYSYDLKNAETRKSFYAEWACHFATLSDKFAMFDTTIESLGITIGLVKDDEKEKNNAQLSTVQIGDEGERYVYEYEKRRVTEFNFRFAGKVIHLGKTRGLGYDIQSVIAQPGDKAEFVKYIEVKATKRVTAPDVEKDDWFDTINITRNEWVAAQQHRDFYSIFRVYFIRNAVVMFVLNDIAKKCDDNVITAVPMTYRIDFNNNAVDEVIASGGVVNV